MIIKKGDVEKIVLYGGREKLTWQQVLGKLEEEPDYLVNGGMFDTRTGMSVCDTIVAGQLINGGNYTNKGLVMADGLPAATTEEALQKGAKYFLGGSPSIVWKGKVDIDQKGFGSWFVEKGKSQRIGIGVNHIGDIVVEYPKQKMTIRDLAQRMLQLGCVYAINLDGGGSTRVMKKESGLWKAMNYPTENRGVSTWLAIYVKKDKIEQEKGKIKDKAERKIKVCIDAGHGKSTAGKRSFDGAFREYEFNRAVAKRLKYHLERHGIRCFYSCDLEKEKDVSIKSRVEKANKEKADYLISIHANAYGNTWNSVQGWECYVCAKGGKAEGLAEKIRANSVKMLKMKDRGVKAKKFAILVETKMPAVLVEHGFYTNKDEMERLKSEEFRELCAVADCKGILEYLNINWIDE